ncbi:Transp_cyt_pur-domain-containing protein [Sphaerulina musiva SO2202]|uniref:Transp_cyt_pur-domain-containing protein n=1 Tax=Sphaerulina musiva (strain SO2202) TaxID=692275 RepID=M3B5J5_SPHMS|nr:Transp_cyt_pur-domain-containing protein [Sphaerulina musiva SO2202]EMF15057.1 Transp_cyt_pur-domain-containing protein [Sphaerulina musiva SO2202]
MRLISILVLVSNNNDNNSDSGDGGGWWSDSILDLVPLDKTRRTWGGWDYVTYWSTGGFAIYNYSTGSALIAFGLSGKQALAAGIFSPIALAALCVFCGWIGGSHHVTYTVASRMSWGMRGTYFAVFIRLMPGLVWDGIEAWWGGQAVSTMIGTMSLRWANWTHPLAQGTMELKDFVGFVIYYVVYLIVMWLPPEKMHRPFMVSCVGFTLTVFGLLIWSVHHSNNTGGPYFARDYQPDALLANSLPWAVIYGATSVLGNVGVVTLSQADWCRFAKNGNRIPMIAQIVACPLMIYAAYALGIVVTSAASQTLGSALWQPYLLLRAIQKYHNNSPRSRAAVFFASATCAYAQVCVNIVLNSVSSAMDLTAWSPKYLNIRRGAYLIAAVGIAVNPWQLTATAQTFIAVLNGFGIFYGPCSGILIADFWIVRKRFVKMDDLYRGNEQSVYWYWHGFNWRAFLAFSLAITPAMPGYIIGCSDLNQPPNAWMKLSRLGFITGFTLSMFFYYLFNKIAPPPGLGLGERKHDEDTLILPSAYRQDVPTQGRFSCVLDGEAVSMSGRSSEREKDGDEGGGEKKVSAVVHAF